MNNRGSAADPFKLSNEVIVIALPASLSVVHNVSGQINLAVPGSLPDSVQREKSLLVVSCGSLSLASFLDSRN